MNSGQYATKYNFSKGNFICIDLVFLFLDQGKHMTMVKTYCGLAKLALAKDDLDGAMNHIETGKVII